MKTLSLVLVLVSAVSASAASLLSPTIDEVGDFVVSDSHGTIHHVGHVFVDFVPVYRAFAAGEEYSGISRFRMGRYGDGRVIDLVEAKMSFVVGPKTSVFHLRPGVADGEIDLVFVFDPAVDVIEARVIEGNISGPKHVGYAKIRFRK